MPAKHYLCIIIIAFVVILSAGCTQPAAQQPVTAAPAITAAPAEPAVTMISPVAPIPVRSTNGVNIAYELELRSLGDSVPETIDVIDPTTGKVIYTPPGKRVEELLATRIKSPANRR